ncbi:hypothetical protein LIER_08922 [Lithospermum erythrorhizon]|uniref:Uncharacterized protein n=1 Tax=Lithospermum erythrorhizon TaxID=34254 RepID=A0AAV3PDZ3_LITER
MLLASCPVESQYFESGLSHTRTNSEHKVLAAWLNSLTKSGDSSSANPLAGLHLLNDMAVMLNLDEVENFSVTDMLSTPLTTEIEDVDSPTEICSKCNSNNIPSLGSADTVEMTDAISQSLCLSCSSGMTQTEKIVIEDLDTVGSSCLSKCGSSGHHNCKTTRDSEKDYHSNDVSLCASSNDLVSDTVKAPNPMQFLPHFLFSRDNVETGSNDNLSFKSPLRSLKATSTEDNVEVVIPKNSLPQNPLQLLPHMVKQSDNLSAEQLSCSCVVEPVKDDKINLHCKEKRMETGVLRSWAERNSIDTQLHPVMKPALSKRRMPKKNLKTEVRDSLKQPLGCEKLEEIVNPVNRNLCNQRSGCDRWSLQGVSSRLKASLRHDDCSYYCDRMCYKYYVVQHINELEIAVGRRFTLFAFPMKSLEKDVIYSTTADVVAFGKTSKR